MTDTTQNEEARAYILTRTAAHKGIELPILCALLKTHSIAEAQRFVQAVQTEGKIAIGKAGSARWKVGQDG